MDSRHKDKLIFISGIRVLNLLHVKRQRQNIIVGVRVRVRVRRPRLRLCVYRLLLLLLLHGLEQREASVLARHRNGRALAKLHAGREPGDRKGVRRIAKHNVRALDPRKAVPVRGKL